MKSLIAFALLLLVSTVSLGAVAAQQRHFRLPPASTDPQPNPDLTDEEIRNHVEANLGNIDSKAPAGQWKVLGIRAEAPLLTVLNDPQSLPTRRARAIDGLTAVGTSRTDLFKTIANNEAEPYVVRFAALRGLGSLLPKDAVVAQLTPLLQKAKDMRVRAAAGAVLATHVPESCPAVRAQINREDESVRLRYSRAMDACFGQK